MLYTLYFKILEGVAFIHFQKIKNWIIHLMYVKLKKYNLPCDVWEIFERIWWKKVLSLKFWTNFSLLMFHTIMSIINGWRIKQNMHVSDAMVFMKDFISFLLDYAASTPCNNCSVLWRTFSFYSFSMKTEGSFIYSLHVSLRN